MPHICGRTAVRAATLTGLTLISPRRVQRPSANTSTNNLPKRGTATQSKRVQVTCLLHKMQSKTCANHWPSTETQPKTCTQSANRLHSTETHCTETELKTCTGTDHWSFTETTEETCRILQVTGLAQSPLHSKRKRVQIHLLLYRHRNLGVCTIRAICTQFDLSRVWYAPL